MEHFLNILQQNDDFIRQWGYAAFFAAAWLEGLNSMIIGGFIASLGKLSVWGVLVVMTLGHICSGFSWYAVGFFGGHKPLARWGKYIRFDEDRLALAHGYFERHGGKAVFVTKFTVGLTIVALIIAGALKMRLKKFMLYNALGSLGWASVTIFFGYSFGLSFKLIANYIESFTRVVIFFFAFLGGAMVFWYILRTLFHMRLMNTISNGLISLVRNKKKSTHNR